MKNKIWKGLNRYFPKAAHLKSEEGQWGPIKKNSTPSPWKRRKTISSAFFCASGAWWLKCSKNKRHYNIMYDIIVHDEGFIFWFHLSRQQNYIFENLYFSSNRLYFLLLHNSSILGLYFFGFSKFSVRRLRRRIHRFVQDLARSFFTLAMISVSYSF